MPEKFYSLLGLAQRAGKIASGEAAAAANIEKKKARLVLIAQDASGRTGDEFISLCRRSKVRYIIYGEKIRYGLALGKSPRSIVTILDDHFAKSLMQIIKGEK